MVRNHQAGYPYINLSLFLFFLKISRNLNFFGKIDWSMNSGMQRARYIKQKNFIFKTLQKMVTKLGQFTKPGAFSKFQLFKLSQLSYHFFCRVLKMKIFFRDPSLHFSFAFFCLLKISRNFNCFGKIDWSMNSERQREGDR